MLLNITITGDKELIGRIDKMPEAVRYALYVKITTLSLKLEAWVKTRKLNGQVLNRISGRLARSITQKVTQGPGTIVARVFSTGDVPYAAIHEFGGTTSPHVILPKKAAALAFVVGGKQIFARKVNHPGSKMPERSFMRSSLKDMSTEISMGMKETVVRAIQGQIDG